MYPPSLVRLVTGALAVAPAAWAAPAKQPPASGLVTWDKYSLNINGSRVFVKSVLSGFPSTSSPLPPTAADGRPPPAPPSSTTSGCPSRSSGMYVLRPHSSLERDVTC